MAPQYAENVEGPIKVTLYFLVNALNQMDIDLIRNEILSEILPVRV